MSPAWRQRARGRQNNSSGNNKQQSASIRLAYLVHMDGIVAISEAGDRDRDGHDLTPNQHVRERALE